MEARRPNLSTPMELARVTGLRRSSARMARATLIGAAPTIPRPDQLPNKKAITSLYTLTYAPNRPFLTPWQPSACVVDCPLVLTLPPAALPALCPLDFGGFDDTGL
jgi:hypothetical protein